MSEIRANTISNAAGTGPATLTGQYAAKAWANFTTVSPTSIRDSQNISSITDIGTGNSTLAVTNSFSNTNAGCTGFCHYLNTLWMVSPSIRLSAVGQVYFQTANTTPAGQDCDLNGFAIHGDLA